MGDAEKQRAYRDRQRGGPPREPAPHGSLGAMRRHERAGEALCDECAEFRSKRNRANYEKRKGTGPADVE